MTAAYVCENARVFERVLVCVYRSVYVSMIFFLAKKNLSM